MGALGCLGIGLSVLFAFFLAVLLAEILYMLCCRRRRSSSSSSARRRRSDSRRVNSVHVVEALSRDAAFVGSFGGAAASSSSSNSSSSPFPSSSSFSSSSDFLPVSKFFAAGLFPIAEETKEEMMDVHGYCTVATRVNAELPPVRADRDLGSVSPPAVTPLVSSSGTEPTVSSTVQEHPNRHDFAPLGWSSGSETTFCLSEPGISFGCGVAATLRSNPIRFGSGPTSFGTETTKGGGGEEEEAQSSGTPFATPPTSPESADSISPVTAASRFSVMSASPPSASSSPAVGGGRVSPPVGSRFSARVSPAESPEHGPLGLLLLRRFQSSPARFSPLRPAQSTAVTGSLSPAAISLDVQV